MDQRFVFPFSHTSIPPSLNIHTLSLHSPPSALDEPWRLRVHARPRHAPRRWGRTRPLRGGPSLSLFLLLSFSFLFPFISANVLRLINFISLNRVLSLTLSLHTRVHSTHTRTFPIAFSPLPLINSTVTPTDLVVRARVMAIHMDRGKGVTVVTDMVVTTVRAIRPSRLIRPHSLLNGWMSHWRKMDTFEE